MVRLLPTLARKYWNGSAINTTQHKHTMNNTQYALTISPLVSALALFALAWIKNEIRYRRHIRIMRRRDRLASEKGII